MDSRVIRWLAAAMVLAIVGFLAYDHYTTRPLDNEGSLVGEKHRLLEQFPEIELKVPVWLTHEPGTNDRWWAVENQGRIVAFRPGDEKPALMLDIEDRVEFGGELGLFSLAFHPDWPTEPHVYLDYTTKDDGQLVSHVFRFSRAEEGPGLDPSSEKILLRIEQPTNMHNGGQVTFGPDGYLYIGIGDGGIEADPEGYAQNPAVLLGSIARIDVAGGDPYAIPADNPFADGKDGAPEVFAYGFRNPWRFSFDRETGELWVGDVGLYDREEIDRVRAGGNYGWNIREGTQCLNASLWVRLFAEDDCGGRQTVPIQPPVYDYQQKDGDRAITGGYVYRGSKMPALVGHYVFADFMSGKIWSIDPANPERRLLVDTNFLPASFFETPEGELGILDYGGGGVYLLAPR